MAATQRLSILYGQLTMPYRIKMPVSPSIIGALPNWQPPWPVQIRCPELCAPASLQPLLHCVAGFVRFNFNSELLTVLWRELEF